MDRIEIKLASDDFDAKTGEFAGYGAIFGNVDSYGDVIAKGAFKTTLREWEERGKLPPMLLQHGGWGASVDDMLPVGQWLEMEENAKGLKVKGKLFALGTERGQYVYEGMKSGELDGLSIGFRVKKFTMGTKPSEPRRTLEEIDLMEVSIVTFPANGKARVSAVKSYDARLWRAIEADLKADPKLNLSSAQAVSAVAILKKHLREEGEATPDLSREADEKALADALRRTLNIIGVS